MERSIRVFLADQSADYLELLRAELDQRPGLEVVGVAARGDEAYAMLSEAGPDVLLTDLILPGLDGLSLLRRLKSDGTMPHTVVLSAFVTDRLAQEVSRLGAEEYMQKPCDLAALVGRIREVADPDFRQPFAGYDRAIVAALREFGVNTHLHGYAYLREGIRRTIEDRGVTHGVTKILYPDLGKHFNTNAECIEHSMRSAIDKAWKRMRPEEQKSCLGGAFAAEKKTPGNARFINAVANYIESGYESVDVWKTE